MSGSEGRGRGFNMNIIPITELSDFYDYITRIACNGESFVLIKGEQAVAELLPISAGKKLGELEEILESLPKFSKQELEDFAKDLSDIRKQSDSERLKNTWE